MGGGEWEKRQFCSDRNRFMCLFENIVPCKPHPIKHILGPFWMGPERAIRPQQRDCVSHGRKVRKESGRVERGVNILSEVLKKQPSEKESTVNTSQVLKWEAILQRYQRRNNLPDPFSFPSFTLTTDTKVTKKDEEEASVRLCSGSPTLECHHAHGSPVKTYTVLAACPEFLIN